MKKRRTSSQSNVGSGHREDINTEYVSSLESEVARLKEELRLKEHALTEALQKNAQLQLQIGSQVYAFPDDVLFVIWSKLDGSTVTRCERVCKSWRRLIAENGNKSDQLWKAIVCKRWASMRLLEELTTNEQAQKDFDEVVANIQGPWVPEIKKPFSSGQDFFSLQKLDYGTYDVDERPSDAQGSTAEERLDYLSQKTKKWHPEFIPLGKVPTHHCLWKALWCRLWWRHRGAVTGKIVTQLLVDHKDFRRTTAMTDRLDEYNMRMGEWLEDPKVILPKYWVKSLFKKFKGSYKLPILSEEQLDEIALLMDGTHYEVLQWSEHSEYSPGNYKYDVVYGSYVPATLIGKNGNCARVTFMGESTHLAWDYSDRAAVRVESLHITDELLREPTIYLHATTTPRSLMIHFARGDICWESEKMFEALRIFLGYENIPNDNDFFVLLMWTILVDRRGDT
eukprot:TRINITY_DN2648_c0_g2_i1.p1 TRINITY_DN2648_c0_g2~~TRINITY_DN2648_c0_g2_i1.p1  ORF type:complete len:452 (+),score=37.36 TRINITY_DN2648_c0_g2_i1:36-1391(+)